MDLSRTALITPLPRIFDIRLTLEHLRTSSYGVAYRVTDDGALQRPLDINGHTVVATYRFTETDGGALEVSVQGTQGMADGEAQAAVEKAVETGRFIFGLDDPLTECYAALGADPLLERFVHAFHGLRIVRTPSIYEALVIAIVGQQVSVASAHAMRSRLMAGLENVVEAEDGARWHAFPTPERLADASLERLRELGMSRQKASYLKELARRATMGELLTETLRPLSDTEVITRLTDCPGVGRWTAEIVLMRGLGRMDIFPAGDVGLQNALGRALSLDRRPTEAEVREMGERWAGWRSYAALYLWASLRLGAFA